MKEKLKYFLFGACSVVGGFLFYAWTRDTAKPTRMTCDNRATNTPDPAASSSATSAYVARRRAQMQKQKASQSCDSVRAEMADASLPEADTSAPGTPDHAVQNTGVEENSK